MRRKKNSGLIVIIAFTAVVALSIVGLIFAQNLRQARIESPVQVTSQDDIPRLTVDEAYQAQINGEGVIVDTRSEAQFQQQHIAGSINVPLDQLETRMAELDPGTWYITYCT